MRSSAPNIVSAGEVVNSFMFEASGRRRREELRQRTWLRLASRMKRPPPPLPRRMRSFARRHIAPLEIEPACAAPATEVARARSGFGSGRTAPSACAAGAVSRAATNSAAIHPGLIPATNTTERRSVAVAPLAGWPHWHNPVCMGKVVKLEPSGSRARRADRTRRRRSKTALVLGGGGFTGGVYEIGALRAFDLLAVNRTVNEFDVYVGTSAGSFVASLLANGVTPEEMMRVLNKRLPSSIDDMDLGTLLRPNYRGYLQTAALMPLRMVGLLRSLAQRLGEVSAMDLGVGLAEGLPTGIYSGRGLQSYMEEVLSDPDRTNDFRMLERELVLAATDLDTCERIVLGEGDWADVPISKAVECSTALPIVYEPVELKGRHLIDGGIRSTTNVDIAVERGANFILVVHPLVPYVNDFKRQIPTVFGTRVRRVTDMGLPAIANQTFKLIAHARLHEAVAHWEEKYPGVDIILL